MRQNTFFVDDGDTLEPMFGTPAEHLHRTDSPQTSIDAANSVDTTRLEAMVREAISGFGQAGCISDQVLAKFPSLSYSSVTARYRGLLDKGFIEDTGEKRPGRSGRKQRVMRATGMEA